MYIYIYIYINKKQRGGGLLLLGELGRRDTSHCFARRGGELGVRDDGADGWLESCREVHARNCINNNTTAILVMIVITITTNTYTVIDSNHNTYMT